MEEEEKGLRGRDEEDGAGGRRGGGGRSKMRRKELTEWRKVMKIGDGRGGITEEEIR